MSLVDSEILRLVVKLLILHFSHLMYLNNKLRNEQCSFLHMHIRVNKYYALKSLSALDMKSREGQGQLCEEKGNMNE